MACIKINNLAPAGSDLFKGSESFLNELTEEELGVSGGARATVTITLTYTVTLTRTYSYTWTRTRTF
ncbi:hypothetical protein [Nostoc sp. MG11]|uniref:hypothetical protein n=1 Tax=Nostoc sp. MG11 TaxID=2721166 RepID=UPI001868CE3F|nr:hypothetical protein [Nostoc sp. MG11]